MSNYSKYLLNKQLDVLNPAKLEKQYVCCCFHPILEKEKMTTRRWWYECYKAMHPLKMCIVHTRSWFKHNAPAIDSMPRNFLQDLIWLLHFVDDWKVDENNFEWNRVFDFPNHDDSHAVYACAHCIKLAFIFTFIKLNNLPVEFLPHST